jgi:hypothetical protein
VSASPNWKVAAATALAATMGVSGFVLSEQAGIVDVVDGIDLTPGTERMIADAEAAERPITMAALSTRSTTELEPLLDDARRVAERTAAEEAEPAPAPAPDPVPAQPVEPAPESLDTPDSPASVDSPDSVDS